ncbi:MAG: condensation domain-containing protein, partial [Rivularia sp. ALOHA_DT_140]|nr:condensation domain-containing protein [Rivularia sp. ALOHA_DT_140]
MIGFFAYPVLLRNDLSGNSDFEGLLKRIGKVVSKAYAHQNIPLSKVVEATKCQNLVRVLFSFLGQNQSSMNLPDLTLTPIWEASKTPTDMDLFLTLMEVDEELRGIFEYNPDLFDEDTVIELINSYCLILEQCVNSPQIQLDEFKLTEGLEAKVNLFFEKQEDKEDKFNTVAITGSFTTEPIADSLKFWLQELDLNQLQVEFAPYNQVFQQLYAADSLLSQNQQGINVVLIRFEDWLRFEYSESKQDIFVEKIEQNVRELIQAVKTARLNNNTPYLLCLCPGTSNTAFLQQMEAELIKELTDVSGVYVVNSTELINNYPVEQLYDSHTDKLGHVPFT